MDKADYFGAKRIDLSTVNFTPELLNCLPRELALRYRFLPIYDVCNCLGIALADPSDLDSIDGLHHLLGKAIDVLVADEEQLDQFLALLYGSSDNPS